MSPLQAKQRSRSREDALLVQARRMLAAGHHARALELTRQMLTDYPRNVEGLLLYARLIDDQQKARRAVEKALRIQPDNRQARQLLRRLEQAHRNKLPSKPAASRPRRRRTRQDRSDTEPARRLLPQPASLEEQEPVLQGNPMAFGVGVVFAVFFLTFGVAHILNGKTIAGIGLAVLGWAIYLPIVITLLLPSASQAGLVCLGIFHMLLALGMSARGADYL